MRLAVTGGLVAAPTMFALHELAAALKPVALLGIIGTALYLLVKGGRLRFTEVSMVITMGLIGERLGTLFAAPSKSAASGFLAFSFLAVLIALTHFFGLRWLIGKPSRSYGDDSDNPPWDTPEYFRYDDIDDEFESPEGGRAVMEEMVTGEDSVRDDD